MAYAIVRIYTCVRWCVCVILLYHFKRLTEPICIVCVHGECVVEKVKECCRCAPEWVQTLAVEAEKQNVPRAFWQQSESCSKKSSSSLRCHIVHGEKAPGMSRKKCNATKPWPSGVVAYCVSVTWTYISGEVHVRLYCRVRMYAYLHTYVAMAWIQRRIIIKKINQALEKTPIQQT